MMLILAILEKGWLKCSTVQSCRKERQRGHQSRFMIEEVGYCDVLLIRPFQPRQYVTHPVRQAQTMLVIQLHDGKQCSRSLGHRGDVIDIVISDKAAVTVFMLAKTFVIDSDTVTDDKYLAARICFLTDAFYGNLVYLRQHIRIHSYSLGTGLHGHGVGSKSNSRTGICHTGYSHREPPVCRPQATDDTCHMSLQIVMCGIGHHHGR